MTDLGNTMLPKLSQSLLHITLLRLLLLLIYHSEIYSLLNREYKKYLHFKNRLFGLTRFLEIMKLLFPVINTSAHFSISNDVLKDKMKKIARFSNKILRWVANFTTHLSVLFFIVAFFN